MEKVKIETIDEYIYIQDKQYQEMLFNVKKTIKDIVPEAQERMSYGIPTFWQKQNIIHFALMKNHLGIYPGSEAIVEFEDRLKIYKTSKGTIKMPLDQAIDYQLIEDITKYRLDQINKEKLK